MSEFIASSYCAQQRISTQLDELIAEFGDMEFERLMVGMKEKPIVLCEDETFHPEICLVAMEPLSNYIFLEQYASDRSGQTWTEAVGKATGDLPVTVLQNTSDGGKGLIQHTSKGLNAHHSPDLFHVNQDVSRATSAPLASRVKSCQKEIEKCTGIVRKLETADSCEQCAHDIAVEREQAAYANLEEARHNQEIVKKANKDIGRIYHPFDPLSGKSQDAQTFSDLINQSFDNIRKATAGLPEKCKERIEKAYRVTAKMTATIAFFFYTVASIIDKLDLCDSKRQLIHDRLVPGFYLQMVAKKEKDPERKQLIVDRSQELLSILNEPDGPLSDCSTEELEIIKQTASQCAGIFQRSSSCVEGRNAQLSLRHHGMHRLSDKKLKALTVLHNYYLVRPDGTTPAQRLFEKKPIDMFEWLLKKMPLPPLPRSRFKKAA